uniref:Uncharacterized protein n=1 Tax=Anopheles atroparvus TaxID=41427 RepID=A0AAG5CVH3_ANOAO
MEVSSSAGSPGAGFRFCSDPPSGDNRILLIGPTPIDSDRQSSNPKNRIGLEQFYRSRRRLPVCFIAPAVSSGSKLRNNVCPIPVEMESPIRATAIAANVRWAEQGNGAVREKAKQTDGKKYPAAHAIKPPSHVFAAFGRSIPLLGATRRLP